MLAEVILFANGMVAALDEKGGQIEVLQGPFILALPACFSGATKKTIWMIGVWRADGIETIETTRHALGALLEIAQAGAKKE